MKQAEIEAKRLRQVTMQQEREMEEKFRQIMLEKFAQDDRIEQMNAQKRRMKLLWHSREVQTQTPLPFFANHYLGRTLMVIKTEAIPA